MRDPILRVYSANLGSLRKVVGSRREDLMRALSSKDDSPAVADAVRSLVMRGGPPFFGDPATMGLAFAALCQVFTLRLGDDSVASVTMAEIRSVDALLKPLGLGISLGDLVYRGVPLASYPEPNGMPMVGHVDARAVGAAHLAWEAAQPRSDDPRIDSILADMGDWLTVAAARGDALVGICM